MAAEMLSICLCSKSLNRHLLSLNLPCEAYSQTSSSEEEVFMRLYDIEHFGKSPCLQIHKMWFEREQARNLAFLSLI